MSLSIRQEILSAHVERIRASGQFRAVHDAEPFKYERGPMPAHYVVEGNETVDHAQVFGKAVCDLTIIGQSLFLFDSANPQQSLYRVGRLHLARLQETVMGDFTLGGRVLLTLEQGNAIGFVESENKPFGVLTTEWVLRYRRDTFDPTKR